MSLGVSLRLRWPFLHFASLLSRSGACSRAGGDNVLPLHSSRVVARLTAIFSCAGDEHLIGSAAARAWRDHQANVTGDQSGGESTLESVISSP